MLSIPKTGCWQICKFWFELAKHFIANKALKQVLYAWLSIRAHAQNLMLKNLTLREKCVLEKIYGLWDCVLFSAENFFGQTLKCFCTKLTLMRY
jgi:hypothetical protein